MMRFQASRHWSKSSSPFCRSRFCRFSSARSALGPRCARGALERPHFLNAMYCALALRAAALQQVQTPAPAKHVAPGGTASRESTRTTRPNVLAGPDQMRHVLERTAPTSAITAPPPPSPTASADPAPRLARTRRPGPDPFSRPCRTIPPPSTPYVPRRLSFRSCMLSSSSQPVTSSAYEQRKPEQYRSGSTTAKQRPMARHTDEKPPTRSWADSWVLAAPPPTDMSTRAHSPSPPAPAPAVMITRMGGPLMPGRTPAPATLLRATFPRPYQLPLARKRGLKVTDVVEPLRSPSSPCSTWVDSDTLSMRSPQKGFCLSATAAWARAWAARAP